MPARAHDDRIIACLGRGVAPGAVPAKVVAHGFARDGKDGIALHAGESPPDRTMGSDAV